METLHKREHLSEHYVTVLLCIVLLVLSLIEVRRCSNILSVMANFVI